MCGPGFELRQPTGGDQIPERRAFLDKQREAVKNPPAKGNSRMPQVPPPQIPFYAGTRG